MVTIMEEVDAMVRQLEVRLTEKIEAVRAEAAEARWVALVARVEELEKRVSAIGRGDA